MGQEGGAESRWQQNGARGSCSDNPLSTRQEGVLHGRGWRGMLTSTNGELAALVGQNCGKLLKQEPIEWVLAEE